VEDAGFWVDLVARNSNKLQKLDLEGKSVETSMCSHLGHQYVDQISMYDEYYYESHDLSLKFSRK